MPTLHTFGVVLLGAVFAMSSWSKLHDRDARRRFVTAVRGWQVAPDRFAGRVATAVTTAEAVTTFLLLASLFVPVAPFRVAAGAASVALLLVLTAGLVLLLRRGTTAGCACFGTSTSPAGPRHVVRNLVLTAVAVATAGSAVSVRAPAPAAAVVAVGLAALAALLVTRFDDLVELFAPGPTTSGS